ncbi:ComEA family DNA-binding protein [Pseudomonas sp. GD03944]|uniref:ComEA family DNA-binding protein n=1 Tax=Pseudomonas sp. GD03944 TaxID=2975409 RepID=UPI00244710D8|nr:ComEA family DNA-binding protein [Pseudomonas sp. GD03944]MDH1261693.1 ComEA family DNA-binding protein [Pseudomonas sp. GD03944]
MRKHTLRTLLFACLVGTSLAVSAQTGQGTAPTSETPSAVSVTMVNLNTADVATLDRELNGVGAAKAKAIVDYREANGNFTSVDELLEVKGIGEAILERNRSKLSVN